MKTARRMNGQNQSLTNGNILSLGRILGQTMPDDWQSLLGSPRLIGESAVHALEKKAKGLSVAFRDYLLNNGKKNLPEILAELFFAAESKIRWEVCPNCSGKGFKWRIFGIVGRYCSICKGKGGWVWNPEEGMNEEDEAVPRLLASHQPTEQGVKISGRPPGW